MYFKFPVGITLSSHPAHGLIKSFFLGLEQDAKNKAIKIIKAFIV